MSGDRGQEEEGGRGKEETTIRKGAKGTRDSKVEVGVVEETTR